MWVPVPAAVGVYDAWQEDNLPEPDKVQGEPVKPPELSVAKLTVPVGVVGVNEVAFTVAVQVVAEFARIDVGLQATEVEVGGSASETVTVVVPLLALWAPSPP